MSFRFAQHWQKQYESREQTAEFRAQSRNRHQEKGEIWMRCKILKSVLGTMLLMSSATLAAKAEDLIGYISPIASQPG